MFYDRFSFQIPAFSWLALNFLGYYCAFGVIQPFFPLWLQSHHYSEFFIAFVMSSAYLFRFLGGLVAVQTGAAARFVVANNSAGNVGWCVGVVGGCGERGGGVVVGGVDLVVFCVEWR